MARKKSRPQPKLTAAQLDERLEALERERAALTVSPRWWLESSGRFKNDPAFDEIVRLGRQQRNAATPRPRGNGGPKANAHPKSNGRSGGRSKGNGRARP